MCDLQYKEIAMTNITLAIDEQLLEQGRTYAQNNGMSFNTLVRTLIEKTVGHSTDWLDEVFTQMDESGANSNGQTWTREDLYRG